ncbi:hypothetical protein PTI98_004368 [Pleurotus ostreatus]|nr:hypothetical protein PTI98_004368 [Pleurotus ostreatus]
MDIFQGNAYSSIGAAHPCSSSNQYRCQDEIECGERYDYTYAYENPCDKDGCEFNTYRLGNPSFFGPGGTVDTNHKFTVTTQFITDTGEDDGDVVEIRRSYKQNDNDIPVPFSSIVPPPSPAWEPLDRTSPLRTTTALISSRHLVKFPRSRM